MLRSNDGAVDASIDELLTMSSERSEVDGGGRKGAPARNGGRPDLVQAARRFACLLFMP